MTCHVCGSCLPAIRRDAKYCSKVCSLAGQPPCSVGECERPRRAKGLCNPHYKEQYGGGYRAYQRTCVICGFDWQTSRSDGKYCSDICKSIGYGGVSAWPVPDLHPSRSTAVPADHPSRAPIAPSPCICEWCGIAFARHERGFNYYCTIECRRRAKRVRRKAREADGHTYSWSQVTRVLLLLDGCCAYCDQPIGGPPDPDHVVPLSRGGSNGSANILPACRPCNSDKRDLLLHEWAEDRARRGKAPVRTVIDRSHPAFAHLLPDVFTSCAA